MLDFLVITWIVLKEAVAYIVFLLFVILSYVFPKDTFHDFKRPR